MLTYANQSLGGEREKRSEEREDKHWLLVLAIILSEHPRYITLDEIQQKLF